MSELLLRLDEAAARVRARADLRPHLGVVAGSGLGAFADSLEEAVVVPFEEIPHFPAPTVPGHSGALVVNYPWDYTYDLTPDDAAIEQFALEYSTYNLPMYNGSFPQGITNGAQWYVTTGCLQDWSYAQTGCIDVTTAISCPLPCSWATWRTISTISASGTFVDALTSSSMTGSSALWTRSRGK